jgi:predicted aspartyl protease
MGLTHLKVSIANPARPNRKVTLRFLVDSGAALSVVPTTVLRKLGVKPHSERSLILVDGTEIKRRVGDVMFHYDGQRGASPVIFGEEGDSVLLGVHGSRRPADLTCAAAERAAFSATAS